jgi:Ca2+-binding EF-hand superfamily protein
MKEQQENLREGFSLQAKNGQISVEDLVDYFNDWQASMTDVNPSAFKNLMKAFWGVEC